MTPRRPPAPSASAKPAASAYSRWLLVARVVYVPVAILVLLAAAGAFVLVMAGSRHASGDAVTSAVGIIAAVTLACLLLPLLLFVPEKGGDGFVRMLHATGGLAMVWMIGVGGLVVWKTFGEATWAEWHVVRLLSSVSLERTAVTPIIVGETVVGLRVDTDFRLSRRIAPGRDAKAVGEALRGTQLEMAEPGVAANPFSGYASEGTLMREGDRVGEATGFTPGPIRLTQVRWLAGVRKLPGDDQPCKAADEFAQPYVREAMARTGQVRWVARTSIRTLGLTLLSGRGRDAWEARSQPLDLPIDAKAWLARYDTLPLPTCDERKVVLDQAREAKRQRELIAGTLPRWQAEDALIAGLCTGDLAALAPRVASDLPSPRIYEAAWKCTDETRRPEILRLLVDRISSRPADFAAHCDTLVMLHDGHDADRLSLFLRAGLPITCEPSRPDVWWWGARRHARRLGTPEEIAREVAWIRVLASQRVPVCGPLGDDLDPLRNAVMNKTVEVVAAWLDAGCDPAARPDPATAEKADWSVYSVRMMWMLRRHGGRERHWPALSADEALNAAVNRRMGAPDAAEFNTPFARRGGRVPLHDFVYDVLSSPGLMREVADRGARLDAAANAPAPGLFPTGVHPGASGSWFRPGYERLAVAMDRSLDRLTTQELRRLITPIDLTTGRPAPPPPLTSDLHEGGFGAYLCRRKVITACDGVS